MADIVEFKVVDIDWYFIPPVSDFDYIFLELKTNYCYWSFN